jgi:ubiquinone/menaquinone biosynthesis C-methylase UbiE
MTLKSRFHGEEYRKARPLYPAALFAPIKAALRPATKPAPLQILDLGAGTGYASESFLRIDPAAQVTLLEPDEGMLNHARERQPDATFIHSRAETIALKDESLDGVLIGSAWHWMDYETTLREIDRVLIPDGAVFIFEYQFPKGQDLFDLNEWVRRQFNLYWKAPSQVPRGSLYEITQAFRDDKNFSQITDIDLSEVKNHSADEFADVIFSQSRFLHYEESLKENIPGNYRLKIRNELKTYWSAAETLPFLYCYEGFAFRKRP